MNQMKNNNS